MQCKKLLIPTLFIFLWLALPFAVPAAELPDPRTLTFSPLHFAVPKAERAVLDNGMVVYLMEDHELPQVSLTAFIGTGSVYEPADKAGLAGLTGAVMRSGGTDALAPEAMDDELEYMSSSIESSIGADAGNVSMNSLSKNLDRTLELFAQVLMRPAFQPEKVELARRQTIEALRRQNDDPKGVANRELAKAIYRGTPLGRVPTFGTVRAITRDDMVAFHKKYYHPNNLIMSIAGDFSAKGMVARLNRLFAGWKREEIRFPAVEVPPGQQLPEILHIQKEVNQSVIRMGHIGITKDNPDLYAIRVMDAILGSGGFNSRLMAEVRNNQGLAYNVESSFDIGRRYLGTFTAETETKAESTCRTISLMEEIIAGMTKKPVSSRELKLAKDSIINSFIFGFTNTASVASQKARLEFYHYPPDYLENYRDNIARVTEEDVLRVAKQYLHPEALKLVVVGDGKRFDKPLATLGKVEEVKPETEK